MMLPDFLEPFRASPREYTIGDVFFSRSTYQVEVKDGEVSEWVFIQLDNTSIKDIFCNCEMSHEKNGCHHMVEAVRFLFSKGKKSFEEHFKDSFFHALFYLLFDKSSHCSLKETASEYILKDEKKRQVFFCKWDRSFFVGDEEETEETSIKFSNLPEEELNQWRKGCPSPELQYELSLFSDWAKHLFVSPQVEITYKRSTQLLLKTEHVHIEVELSQEEKQFLEQHGKPLSFYQIPVAKETVDISYDVSFHKTRGLHIEGYLFEKGDILSQRGDCVEHKDKGLLPVFKPVFDTHKISLSLEEIPEFLIKHRHWMQQFPGFELHSIPISEKITYQVDGAGRLSFHKTHVSVKKGQEIDLGTHIYKKGEGFFPKRVLKEGADYFLERTIPSYEVPSFIRHHYQDLENIEHFFSTECPIKGVGLSINLVKRGLIEIAPDYEWYDPKEKKRAVFFDEFVFLPRKGFYKLSVALLPLHYIRHISSSDKEAWSQFFTDLLPQLKKEYRCRVDARLEKSEEMTLTVRPLEDEGVELSYENKKAEVSLKELLSAHKKKERFVPTQLGVIDLSDERFCWLKSFSQKKRARVKKGFELEIRDFFFLSAYERLSLHFHDEEKKVFDHIFSMKAPEEPSYHMLQAELRDYQKIGVEWLWFLYRNNLSGLLCDDMGVGKTHQAMALLASVEHYEAQKGKKARFLVLCPASVIYHWQDKLEQFMPHIKARTYSGLDRNIESLESEEWDLLLCTYNIWRNDYKALHNIHFHLAFFDELQIAKNHISQIHTALLECNAYMKVGLTGTPIENRLRELKALFDIVLPNYMPDPKDFRDLFIKPIEKAGNRERRKLLSKFVKPFVLRRNKKDVLLDLPEKTEDFCFTELKAEQQKLYQSVAMQQVSFLVDIIEDKDNPIPYMHIFSLLSSLKQICNHPAAYLKDVDHFERYDSGKWEVFLELIEEARQSGEKVVVFSQYLSMLDIMQRYFEREGIQFAQIRGQTKLRREEIDRFHKDPKCTVFLGSLKAAGLGIDLTAASIVIHYDRWWNPARENQATDRVYRYGQSRGVQVFKLVTKQSVEEKIDRMIQEKESLLEDVVSFDDHQMIKKMSRDQILDLLHDIAKDAGK